MAAGDTGLNDDIPMTSYTWQDVVTEHFLEQSSALH